MTTDTWPRIPAVTLRRFWVACGIALLMAGVITQPLRWSPLCPLYEPWSLEWIILGCFVGAPDPPPGANGG